MKKLILALFLATTVFAALPPLAQSTCEIKALLADPKFYQAIGSAEQIKNIIRTETGYLILTQSYAMNVDIHYGRGEGPRLIGPVQFQFEFHCPVPLE